MEKEKLEKEIKEIKAQKEEEYILKEKLEKQCIEIEQNIKNKKNGEKKNWRKNGEKKNWRKNGGKKKGRKSFWKRESKNREKWW